MNVMPRITVLVVANVLFFPWMATGQDWPMWRYDPGRTAASPLQLPADLHLQWIRELPKLKPAFRTKRLQFDSGYEPVVAAGLMIVGSSLNDSVTAYQLDSGEEKWRFETNGPVRFAPAVWNQSVLFGSDDGYLYCVDLKRGNLQWKYRAVPSDRKLFGNGRLISVWPVRGGPVVAEGIVYFAAGVWPFEGVFVYALNATSGEIIWLNDRLGTLYGDHPHRTEAVGGLAPQGYLVLSDEELIVPCSAAYPARLNRRTGELIEFKLPTTPRFPGGWFAALDPETAKSLRRGKLTFDDLINRQRHEDKIQIGKGTSGISRQIRTGSRQIRFDDAIAGVEGTTHSILVADQRLIVVTREGSIYCFGAEREKPIEHRLPAHGSDPANEAHGSRFTVRVKQTIAAAKSPSGYAFVIGLKNGDLVRELIRQSSYRVIALDSDPKRISALRSRLKAEGNYGTRCTVSLLEPNEFGLPPYAAQLITTEENERFVSLLPENGTEPGRMRPLQCVRPYGGVVCLPDAPGEHAAWTEILKRLPPSWGEFNITRKVLSEETNQPAGAINVITRLGALPGATNYVGNWQKNQDERVHFPLGVSWFDDTIGNFKRSPQPWFLDGVMVSRGKDWFAARNTKNYSVDFPLHPAKFSDVYTGRLFDVTEVAHIRPRLTQQKPVEAEPTQYRPPYQKDAWNPAKPKQGTRTNPLTGQREQRSFPKNYGCDGGVDYGFLFTMRSGTPAFYDKRLESGTTYLSGPRSGCTNSIIPANGLLNVPYFYEGCTCSYPLPASLALIPLPESHEQWAVWGESEPKQIQRIGVNFGAPGDRMTKEGTLWLNYPAVGGPSPKLSIEVSPTEAVYNYQHSLWMQRGVGWPWVHGSAAEALTLFTLHSLQPGRYTLRLFFSERTGIKPGERIQTLALPDRILLKDFEIRDDAQGVMKGVVKEFTDVRIDGTFRLQLDAQTGISRINGLELVRTP